MTKAISSVGFNPYNDFILHLRGTWHFVLYHGRFAVTSGYTFSKIRQPIAAVL
jgi:hypothetical protein